MKHRFTRARRATAPLPASRMLARVHSHQGSQRTVTRRAASRFGCVHRRRLMLTARAAARLPVRRGIPLDRALQPNSAKRPNILARDRNASRAGTTPRGRSCLLCTKESTQSGTSSDSSGITTVRLQRRHLSSTPSGTRRASKLPQAQRRSACAQTPRGLDGFRRLSLDDERAGWVMGLLDAERPNPYAIESHYQ